jgi:hypothetical protein
MKLSRLSLAGAALFIGLTACAPPPHEATDAEGAAEPSPSDEFPDLAGDGGGSDDNSPVSGEEPNAPEAPPPAPSTAEPEPEPEPVPEPSAWALSCGDDGTGASPTEHPFAPMADVSHGLVNASADLEELLEYGTLDTACDEWLANPDDQAAKLRCGMWMFFYETFDTAGMPGGLIRYLLTHFVDDVGPGFSAFGMIPDPYSDDDLPLGFAPTPVPEPDSYSFTCASCHFGQMPDGRYAAGYPNHEYDYGGHVLSLFLFPQLAQPFADVASHDEVAVARVQPMLDHFRGDIGKQLAFGLVALGLFGQEVPDIDPDVERAYATWRSGTMDFMMAPTPIDDGVHTLHKIQPLWGIPTDAQVEATGADGALLGWSGGTYDVRDFLRAFVDLGFGDLGQWDDVALEPLAAYVESLQAPSNPTPPLEGDRYEGCQLFEEHGCLDCHDGVGGAGKRVYAVDEVGTDPAISRWMDAELDGEACCGIEDPDFELTHGVKSPRLRGLWSFSRFLHNGSLDSLDQLLCLEPRPDGGPEPFGSQGHTFGCDDMTDDEKRALIAYLESH